MNGVRGEVRLEIGGVPRRLCLTLGALAEIETLLDCHVLSALPQRLASLSAADLSGVVAALLRGGGEYGTADTVGQSALAPSAAMAAIADAFEAAFAAPDAAP